MNALELIALSVHSQVKRALEDGALELNSATERELLSAIEEAADDAFGQVLVDTGAEWE